MHNNIIRHLTLLAAAVTLSATSCERNRLETIEGPVKVGFYTTDMATKTSLSEDGLSINWAQGDTLGVWAKGLYSNNLALNGTAFEAYGALGSKAVFTALLSSPMTAGTYVYAASYPLPVSKAGTTATFEVPSDQNGDITRYDILVTDNVEASALKISSKIEDYTGLKLKAKHMLHMFKVHIPMNLMSTAGSFVEAGIVADTVICGYGTVKMLDNSPKAIMPVSKLDSVITVKKDIDADKEYMSLMAFPFASTENNTIRCFINTINGPWYSPEIPTNGKNFLPGHITTITWTPGERVDARSFNISLTGNKVGEPVKKMELTAPEGWAWKTTGTNAITINGTSADTIAFNTPESLRYTLTEEIYNAGTADIQVAIYTEHFKIKKTVTIDDVREYIADAEVSVPYLLKEDFSTLESFSNHDDKTTGLNGDAGNDFSTTFLNGWSGGRVGGEAGKCIRISGRRESGLYVDVHYWARVDSAPIFEVIKEVSLTINFDYGIDEAGYVTSGSYKYVGQDFQIGYIKGTNVRNSGNTEITQIQSVSIAANESRTGSFDNTPKHYSKSFTLKPGEDYRMTWRNNPKSKKEFGGNSTAWLYIDNVELKLNK